MVYKDHLNACEHAGDQLACFSTGPSIRRLPQNFIVETVASFIFILGIFYIKPAGVELGTFSALPVALLVAGIGFGIGGPTGWAINPARDLGPRIMHFVLPIKGKGPSDWAYAAIPIFGPIVGGILAAIILCTIFAINLQITTFAAEMESIHFRLVKGGCKNK